MGFTAETATAPFASAYRGHLSLPLPIDFKPVLVLRLSDLFRILLP